MTLQPIYRITTFVPPANLESLLAGILSVVELSHGNYDQCAWWCDAIEQYRPLPGARPTAGAIAERSRDVSVRLEFSLPRDSALLMAVLQDGLVAHHPWEEPEVLVEEIMELRVQS